MQTGAKVNLVAYLLFETDTGRIFSVVVLNNDLVFSNVCPLESHLLASAFLFQLLFCMTILEDFRTIQK